jgi:anti-sigma factor RsiW
MANGEEPTFEDPALKQALNRSVAVERAPDALRHRIAQALAEAPAAPSASEQAQPAKAPAEPIPFVLRLFRPRPLAGLVAAVVLIACGIFAYMKWVAPHPGTLPEALAQAIADRNDACAAIPDHHVVDKPNEAFPLIGQAIEQELHRPILAADLRRDGWTFSGAAVCPVEGDRCAHLLYKRGDQSLSVLSLPASLIDHAPNGALYETRIANHSIVLQVHQGSLFCICGYSPAGALSVADMADLLRQHANEVTAAIPGAKRVTLADVGVVEEKD